ncbi:Nucleoside-diphosphate-sugar pyrophosphorylase family protein [Synechococcus sp. PCC 7502]|uniref:mannose-1-phosphate guanyltransferase n=1 Tax=Synechococcus sp. PCC 7502 TaxID=1173263 RepID=UPI00029FC97E|nr:mannose-1-phosphate guanyltransferase [Synechococcus sp. PCC 7502]AFY73008.1 Nucleoside-diphosphate-sugar pyrophosphorylase family protein [Synechococcus sp. PCC 7502]
MRAVLMAGGTGTRLRPLTCDLPKPMVPILNRPITEHIINLLKRHGILEIIATLHYLPDVIRDYFSDGSDFDVKMRYVVEEEQPLGTAGCVKNVEGLLDQTFLVISGDSITDFDLTAAIKFHRDKRSQATLILHRVKEPMAFGVVITDEEYRIQRFLEKPSTSEVFSDTVNTGIYILEPEVLQYLEPNTPSDFSQDLFPILLERSVPMFGYVAEGYWCDVGSLETYRQSQYDAIRGRVFLDLSYGQQRTGVYVGHNTFIDPSVQIEPPVMIGNNCSIAARVTISAGTIIGDHVTIGANSDLQRPIIGNSVIIGEECHIWACVIARNARISRRSQVMEGAVVGSGCVIEEEVRICPNVRIWPSKKVETGTILTHNLIWGITVSRNLFGHRGVSGLANVEIIPEFAVKLGAAYGATLRPGAQVMVSRDQRPICRMVTRSLISGLMSVGVNIQNLEATAIPISRFIAPTLGVVGGVHVRIHPDRHDHVLIEFLDSNGINISKPQEKKIESTYFKEDFRRARIEEIGEISYPSRIVDYYNSGFSQNLNIDTIRYSACKKVVIDYVYAVSGAVLPRILGKFGSEVIVLNASLNQIAPPMSERHRLLTQLSDVVTALKANFGVQVSANGERLILIDDTGYPIQGELLTAVLMEMALTAYPTGSVVVPVSVSGVIDEIAAKHQGKVIRTKSNPTEVMLTCSKEKNVALGGCAEMGFIFPKLHCGFDAMFAIAKIIEWITVQERTISQVRLDLPKFHYDTNVIKCPWSVKGSLMRHLVESHNQNPLDLTDGVKIFYENHNWVLILPDAGDPVINLYVNSNNYSDQQNWVQQQMQEFSEYIDSFCKMQVALSKDSSLLDN